MLINQAILYESDFLLKMFSLAKGIEIQERIRYDDAL